MSRRTMRAAEGTRPTLRALEEPDEVPTAWDEALQNRVPVQGDITPDCDPNYQPYGTPPRGYALAMAFRHLQKPDAAPAHGARPEPTIIRDANGIPNPYDTAIERTRR